MSRSAGILYRIRNLLPIEARLNYYFAFMYPYLSYNISVWGATNHVHLYPLITQQKRIVRIITNSKISDHTTPPYYSLIFLNWKISIGFLIHTHKATLIDEFKTSHGFNTRNEYLAVPNYHKLASRQHAVSFGGPSLSL